MHRPSSEHCRLYTAVRGKLQSVDATVVLFRTNYELYDSGKVPDLYGTIVCETLRSFQKELFILRYGPTIPPGR